MKTTDLDINGTFYFSGFSFLHLYTYVGHLLHLCLMTPTLSFFAVQLWTLVETI